MSRTLILGDVHGCSTELREICRISSPSRVILVGDLFTKGPDPLGVWELIQDYKMESVLGNHDLYIRKRKSKYPKELIRWVYGLPLFIRGEGWCVTHAGLNPTGGFTSFYMATMMRSWSNGHPWVDSYIGSQLVIYGHDARKGLNDRRPFSLGLDTGCVYGGSLTGYIIEEDRLISVKSEKVYKAIKAIT